MVLTTPTRLTVWRDNLNKLIGKHNLQAGAYFQAVEKNELGGELAEGSYPGYITFQSGCAATAPTTGNPFADLLVGDICSLDSRTQPSSTTTATRCLSPIFRTTGALPAGYAEPRRARELVRHLSREGTPGLQLRSGTLRCRPDHRRPEQRHRHESYR